MFLAECQASGKAWATPWSVMAMARWPQASARLTTFLSGPSLGAHRGQGVHGGHGGVQVELHPLLRGVVLFSRFRRP